MNWNTLKTLGLGIVMTMGIVGCSGFSQPRLTEGDHNSVTDINPPSLASSTPAPSLYQPAPTPVAPISTQQPSMSDVSMSSTPVVTSTPSTGSGNSHVVKKGETLYGIAKKAYGDGKQWTKIASANPGVSPQSLKVGQTIVIP